MPNAGGRPLATPFGTVYATNLTPDPATGIGQWSFSAFQRAMREGISRDGHHLYPAFPYTAFSQVNDEDLTALYAWLMAQPAVVNAVAETRLAFPFNLRSLLGLWNALYLQPGPLPALARAGVPAPLPGVDPARWARGAYLVNGLGHCGACHTPRDALGVERSRSAYLGGALADGWEAPALGALNLSPLRWTEAALRHYLRRGHHADHGIAGGPMAGVVQQLAQLPEADLAAIAHCLVALQGPAPAAAPSAAALVQRAAAPRRACCPAQPRACSRALAAPATMTAMAPALLGLNQALALNPNLHSARPDNLLRTILDGIWQPAFPEIGHMPAVRDALDDAQIAELAAWMRQRYAPGQAPWAHLAAQVARLRAAPG